MPRIALILVAVALAGCPKGSPPPTQDEPTCASAASNVGTLIAADIEQLSGEQRAQVVAMVERHCTDDGWTAEAIACIAGATTGDELDERCEPFLTKEQSEAVDDEFERIVDGGASHDDV